MVVVVVVVVVCLFVGLLFVCSSVCFSLSFYLSGLFTCILCIVVFIRNHYPKSECDFLYVN